MNVHLYGLQKLARDRVPSPARQDAYAIYLSWPHTPQPDNPSTCELHKLAPQFNQAVGSLGFSLWLKGEPALALLAYAKLIYLPPEKLLTKWEFIEQACKVSETKFYRALRSGALAANRQRVIGDELIQSLTTPLKQEIQDKLVTVAKLRLANAISKNKHRS